MSNAAALTRTLVVAALLTAPLASRAAEPAPAAGPERVRYLQSWFGAGDTDQPWELEAEEGPYTRDVGTIPYLGGSALYLHGNGFRYGWEAGGLLGWSSYDSAFRSDSSGLRVAIDASLFTFEVFFGGLPLASLTAESGRSRRVPCPGQGRAARRESAGGGQALLSKD